MDFGNFFLVQHLWHLGGCHLGKGPDLGLSPHGKAYHSWFIQGRGYWRVSGMVPGHIEC